jgi:DNA-binding transcriptional LysR family regulator
MHISNLDIKTLTIFSTVMRLRNLSQTAVQLELTQPAISQAVTRLRKHFGDALLVRTGRGMEPTPRALELLEAVDAILTIAHEQLDSRAAFEPSQARRTFSFFATDFGATLLLPKLASVLREEAPLVTVKAVTNTLRPAKQQLEAAEVDLAVGGFTDLGGSFYQQLLFRDSYVCLAGSLFVNTAAKLSKSAFRSASHVVVAPLPQGYGAVEELVRSEAESGRIAIEVPNFLSLLMVLRETDLLCTVPARVGTAAGRLLGLRTYEPPFALPSLNVKMFWHERLHRDPAHRWFRTLMDRLFRAK